MASMPSTVCAGSSSAVSRVPGPPPRTSIEATAGSSKTTTVEPEPRRVSVPWPTLRPGTSVMRLRMRSSLARRAERHCRSAADEAIQNGARRAGLLRFARNDGSALQSPSAARCIACAMTNVTIFAALLAGMLSFLSPCVLPLVPPYLVYLTGTSLERFADAETKPRAGRQTIAAALLFVLGFSTVFVALGASASVDRRGAARLFGRTRDRRRHRHHHHGSALPRPYADRLADAREAARSRKAGRPVGRLSDGACLCARLDAVHRPDPRRDPGRRGVGSDRGEGRRHACGLFARAGRAVHRRGVGGRSRSPLSSPASAPISAWSKRRWAAFWCSPASRF